MPIVLLFSAIGRSHLGNPGLEAWQPNVIETLTSFVKRHGLDPGDPQEQALDLFKHLLGEARSHRQRIESFTLGDAGLDETDWLCVAGIGSKTRVGLEVGHDEQGRVRFVVDSKLRRNEGIETGDGTVPLLGALSRFIPPERVVCISPDDYGYWEIQAKTTEALARPVDNLQAAASRCCKRRCSMVFGLILSLSSRMVWPRPK